MINVAYGLQQLQSGRVFQQIPECAGLDCGKDLVVVGETGEHQDARLGILLLDLLDRLDARFAGHDQVDEDNVRVQGARFQNGFYAVSRLTDNLDTFFRVQERMQTAAHNVVIIGNQHTDRVTHRVTPLLHCLVMVTASIIPVVLSAHSASTSAWFVRCPWRAWRSSVTRTIVPWSSSVVITSSPLRRATRSRILARPSPLNSSTSSNTKPMPLSCTSNVKLSPSVKKRTTTFWADACLRALLSASWQIR